MTFQRFTTFLGFFSGLRKEAPAPWSIQTKLPVERISADSLGLEQSMVAGAIRPVIFKTDQELGYAAAEEIFAGIEKAERDGERFVLGCPGGRSPRSTYQALGGLISSNQQPLGHLYLAMMDEYASKTPHGSFQNVEEVSHFSCRRFGFEEIRDLLNTGLSTELHLPHSQVLVPNAAHPEEFEKLLDELGIDIFLLASGATDGHVAFNGRGTDRNSGVRVASLSDETRKDNLHTFPEFNSLSEVPLFGVTVGPRTIAALSKKAIMLLQGSHKRLAFDRITSAQNYEADWPATIITECQNPSIFADAAASE